MTNKTKINFFMIYIEEAHAIDGWNIGESAGEMVESHKTLEDRQKCINMFKEKNDVQFPIYPDDMNSSFMNDFASWPVRCFVTENNILKYISSPKNGEVDFFEIFDFVLNL
jgi:hypothetical protein